MIETPNSSFGFGASESGIREEDLRWALREGAVVPDEAIHGVRVLHRFSFIELDAEPWPLLGMALAAFDRAAEALAALECSLHLSPSHAAVRSSLDALRATAQSAAPIRPTRAAPCAPAKL